jgi:hypothetical protein
MNLVSVKKEEYAKSVCMFLSELLRTHRIDLARSAEIAQKTLEHLNLIDSEEDFLKFVKELTLDFQELFQLEERVLLNVHMNRRAEMENLVREFVITTVPDNPKQALTILLEAIKDDCRLEDLSRKFPLFEKFRQEQDHQRASINLSKKL